MLDTVDSGLIAAYAFTPGEDPQRLSWTQCVEHEAQMSDGFLWMHLNVAMQPARRWLSTSSELPEDIIEALLDADSHSHMITMRHGFLLTLNDRAAALGGDSDEMGVIRVWVDRRRIITARRRPLLASERLRRSIEDGDVPDSSVEVFLRLLDLISDNFAKLTASLGRDIDLAEDALLAGHTEGLRVKLGGLRRSAVSIHRFIAPERQALGRLNARAHDWLNADELNDFRQIFEDISALADDVRAAQDRARVLQDEFGALIAEETNRNLYTLSIVSVVLLPMTFITGYFGMNTGGLPFSGEVQHGSLVATVIIGVVGVLTYVILRHRFGRRRD
jgi:zinc transporter